MRGMKYIPILLCVLFSIIIAGAMTARRFTEQADSARLLVVREKGCSLNERIIELLEEKLQARQAVLRVLIDLRVGREAMRLTGKNKATRINIAEREEVLGCI